MAPAQAVAGVQLRLPTKLTGEQYVTREYWREASLPQCPAHPNGGCGFRRHGTYPRKCLPGAEIPRWYCRKAGLTFSLLPDCLAARVPAQLQEMEDVVARAEKAPSREKAVCDLWPDLGLVGAVRKLDRWTRAVAMTLTLARGVAPDLALDPTSITRTREQMATSAVLVELRDALEPRLQALPSPVGFGPRPKVRPSRTTAVQHEMGPDPPTEAPQSRCALATTRAQGESR